MNNLQKSMQDACFTETSARQTERVKLKRTITGDIDMIVARKESYRATTWQALRTEVEDLEVLGSMAERYSKRDERKALKEVTCNGTALDPDVQREMKKHEPRCEKR